MINYVALFVALVLSAIAAFYSIAGLTAIFATAVIPIVIMGSALELAKVVAASWVYQHWHTAPASIRYYLTGSVIVLMFITSMGTFGYLSKAHIDQTIVGSDSMVQLEIIDNQIESEQRRIDNAQRSLSALDRLVDQSDTESAIKLRNSQRRERTRLLAEISAASTTIQSLNVQAAPLRKELKQITAEVGPIKYIADLIYGESSQYTLEKAVRAVIVLIVVVFDPLAIVLLLAANHGINKAKQESITSLPHKRGRPPLNRPQLPEPPTKNKSLKWIQKSAELINKKKRGILEISEDSIVKIK
jgi:hypothetical protein